MTDTAPNTSLAGAPADASAALPQGGFRNPVLAGTYPDPSVCHVGDDYFLVTSTFEYFPGLPIFHSTDLQHWEQVGNAFDRTAQLDLRGVPSSGGLYAPTIRYSANAGGTGTATDTGKATTNNAGTFYIVCTLVHGTGTTGNFVLTATDPRGPWSDPIWLPDAAGIDPSLFFDDDGRLWYCGTHLADNPQWHDQTTVWLRELDPGTFAFIGDTHNLWHGALIGAVWAEGPHIYKRGDWYYLLASEGGTEFNHALSVARSRAVTGPYEGYAANPVFTHRHLGHAASITNVGHADLVEATDGRWAAVLLATRPYGGYHTNLGRETFVVEVEWQNEWPVFAPGVGMLRAAAPAPTDAYTPGPLEWSQLRTDGEDFARIDAAAARVTLSPRPGLLTEPTTPAFVGVRQRHENATFRATLGAAETGSGPGTVAGLVVRQSEAAHITLAVQGGADGGTDTAVATLTRVEGGIAEVIAELPVSVPVTLEVVARGQDYEFWVSTPNDAATRHHVATIDGRFLSSQSAGGFIGVWFGLFAVGDDAPSATTSGTAHHTVRFDSVEYKGD